MKQDIDWENLSPMDKKKQLYLKQKHMLDTFLKTDAISIEQYNTSVNGLRTKMGIDDILQNIWVVKRICEADYGCEERQPGEKLKCLVYLENELGAKKQILVEDEYLRAENIEEGSEYNGMVQE